MIADYQMGNILWEIYRLLVEAGGAKKSSKHKYETKPRKEERENSLTVNNDILQKEIQHQISSIRINYYVDFPKENVVLDELIHIRQLLESPRGTLNSVDSRNEKHDEDDRAIYEVNRSKARARKRLQELKDVKDRSFGRTRTLLVWDPTLRCCLCSATGEHDSDHCYRYRTVAEKSIADAAQHASDCAQSHCKLKLAALTAKALHTTLLWVSVLNRTAATEYEV
ncbi:hypothetical protein COOONC_17018 [Cooperia oncophora]